MLILKPNVHETIWGGSKLTRYSGTTSNKIGHLYSLYSSPKDNNLILNGEFSGTTFNEWFADHKEKFALGEYEYFPMVIALVEAADNLSIQVHPDDKTAAMLDPHMKLGKCESWFFIDAPENGRIFDGCRCKDMEELKRAILDGRMEEATDTVQVQKGDYTYVEAGTLHAMSAGSLVYEIEENAGCTYRFYDFDRVDSEGNRRPLQIPEAYFSIILNNKSEVKRYSEGSPIVERKYLTQHFADLHSYENSSKTLQIMTILDGTSVVDGIEVITGMSIVLEPGDTLELNGCETMMAQPLTK